MPEEVMQDMIKNYKLTFPSELLTLYRSMNGADLFWTVQFFGPKNSRIPINHLSIYGIPLTYDRTKIEPFNISIEDLDRPKGTPKSWLKFGSYYGPENFDKRLDLFVDTDSTKVSAIEHESNKCYVVETWDSIDNCLCSIFDLLQERTE